MCFENGQQKPKQQTKEQQQTQRRKKLNFSKETAKASLRQPTPSVPMSSTAGRESVDETPMKGSSGAFTVTTEGKLTEGFGDGESNDDSTNDGNLTGEGDGES